jgi:glycosyltransferase involved in cell wall biosynthesis
MKIIYVENGDSTFIRLDEEILTRYFSTRVIHLKNTGRYAYFLQLVKLVTLLALRLPFASLAYTRFADWHAAITAFFCSLYGKKLLLVVGGYDAAWLPEFGYGVYHRKTRGKWAKYALRKASLILPNNPGLKYNRNEYEPGITRQGGIDVFVPERKGEVRVLFNGFHTDYWIPAKEPKHSNLVITVAYISNVRTYQIKGINDFINAAMDLPDLEFRLIGANQHQLLSWEPDLPGNLTVIESLRRDELRQQYQEAKVFCLLSITEGMSNVLCEAMLCECIPVVSDVNFNAEIVGGSGFVIKSRQPALIRDTIRKAVNADPGKGRQARERIAKNYSIKRREKELVGILNEAVS